MWLSSVSSSLRFYHQRLLKVLSEAPSGDPLQMKESLRAAFSAVLGLSSIPVPQICVRKSKQRIWEDFCIIHSLSAESWDGYVSTALYIEPSAVPADTSLPAIHLVCGHADGGKLAPAYLSQALSLVRAGARVLIHDNLGQGERKSMGHRDVRIPYAHGFSLQGMIYREAEAWQNWLREQAGVDLTRTGMVGNSGGGLLTLLFASFSDDLAAISSSGYPSSFAYIAAKEKNHCSCNFLPGVVGQIEMWQLYSLFAPKPLFLFQGEGDPLFPEDLFWANHTRVRQGYDRIGAADALEAKVFPGGHSWDSDRVAANVAFFTRVLNMQGSQQSPIWLNREEVASIVGPLDRWPENAVCTEELAARFAGIEMPEVIPPLWELVVPEYGDETLDETWGRGDLKTILAQYELFLRR